MTLHLLCSPFLPQNLLECIDNSQSRFEIENWLNHGAPVSPRAWLLACTDFSFFPPKLVDLRNLLIIPKSAQPFSSQKIKVFCMCCQCWATGHAGLSAAPAFGRGLESLDWGIWVQEGSRMTQGLSVPGERTSFREGSRCRRLGLESRPQHVPALRHSSDLMICASRFSSVRWG